MLRRLFKAAYSAVPFKRRLFGALRPLGLPQSVYRHLHFAGEFTVRMDGKPFFRMEAGHEILENELFWSGWGGTWEAMSTRLWHRLARSSEGILDIGANTGAYALAAASSNPEAWIVAFEPVRRTAERLRRNVERNLFSSIEVDGRAVSDRFGRATLFDAEQGEVNYTASLELGQGENTLSYEVETVSIDGFLAERGWPRVDLVKIDVETHEPAVIRGMAETIARFRPFILLEVLHPKQGDEIAAAFAGTDYLMFNLDEEGRRFVPVDQLRHVQGDNWNNLLCPDEKADLLDL
jgi:FkbM family methyltransferase